MQATDEIARGGRRIRYQPLGLQSGPDEGVQRVITLGNRGPGESSERPVIRRGHRRRQGLSFGSRHRSPNDQNRNYSDNAPPERENSPEAVSLKPCQQAYHWEEGDKDAEFQSTQAAPVTENCKRVNPTANLGPLLALGSNYPRAVSGGVCMRASWATRAARTFSVGT